MHAGTMHVDVDDTNNILMYQNTRLAPQCYALHLVLLLRPYCIHTIQYSVQMQVNLDNNNDMINIQDPVFFLCSIVPASNLMHIAVCTQLATLRSC